MTSETPISVRPADAGDVEHLTAFNCAMAWETEQKQLDRATVERGVQSLLQNPAWGFYCVAEVDREVAGSLMITSEWSDWRDGVFWWIQSVFVRPELRRRGVFQALYRHIEQCARQDRSVCGLRLYVDLDNQIAQSTYESLGMTRTRYQLYEIEFSARSATTDRKASS